MPIPFTKLDKGDPIRVVGGKYAGRKGWKHKGRKPSDDKTCVILSRGAAKKGGEIQPSKAVQIAHEHVQPFERATTKEEIVLEQKPTLQLKLCDFVKELVKLNLAPDEAMLVLVGRYWLDMWKKKQDRIGIDYTIVEEAPTASDGEEEDDSITSAATKF